MGTTLTVAAFVYVSLSVVFLHMKHDLTWEKVAAQGRTPRTCPKANTCEAVLGVEACIQRQVPADKLLCEHRQAVRNVPLDLPYSCECPFEPAFTCASVNSTVMWGFVPSDAQTGTCQPDARYGAWAASVLVAALVGLHSVFSCLLCASSASSATSQRAGFIGSIPGVGLVKSALGSGIAGPAGIAASKALELV